MPKRVGKLWATAVALLAITAPAVTRAGDVGIAQLIPENAASSPGGNVAVSGSPASPLVYLGERPFDPLAQVAGPVPEPEGQRLLYIVQFTGPVTPGNIETLETHGVEVGDYIPNYAYLVRMTPQSARELRSVAGVRAVFRFGPAYKLAPALRQQQGLLTQNDAAALGSAPAAVLLRGFGDAAVDAAPRMYLSGLNGRADLARLAQREDVTWIEPAPRFKIFNDKAASITGASAGWMGHLDGSNQIVAIADTGIDTGDLKDLHPDLQGQLLGVSKWDTADGSDKDGHGTHVAGSVVGTGAASRQSTRGMAPAAKLWVQDVGSGANEDLTGIPDDLTKLFDDAYKKGARIHSNSWGVPVEMGGWVYNILARDVDRYIWNHKDYSILFAAGNEGYEHVSGKTIYDTIATPSTAKNAITVGATENARPDQSQYADNPDQVAIFSSRCCAPDGRIKPDVMAPGTFILSTQSRVRTSEDAACHDRINSFYMYMCGTSMATPITAGVAAQVRQWYQQLGVASPAASLIKATLIHTAKTLPNVSREDQGWGRVSLDNLLAGGTQSGFTFVPEGLAMKPGQAPYVFKTTVPQGSPGLSATLVWTDQPGAALLSPGAPVLVNDLDLVITTPSGKTLYGNSRVDGDRVNNVERIQADEAGEYTIAVRAFQIPKGPQPFSLIVTGVQPPARITAPAIGITTDAKLTVTAEAPPGTARVDLLYDGVKVGSSTKAPYSFTLDAGKVRAGERLMRLVAYRPAAEGGLATLSESVAITVINKVPPSVKLVQPIKNTKLWAPDAALQTIRADVGGLSSIDRVEFYLDGVLKVSATQSPYVSSEVLSGISRAGAYRVKARAYDTAGRYAEDEVTVNIQVDTKAPVVNFTTPKANEVFLKAKTPEVKITGTVKDDDRVSRAELWLDDRRWLSFATGPYTATWNLANVALGVHRLQWRVYDRSGNVGLDMREVRVVEELVPPKVTVTSPTKGSQYWVPETKSVPVTFTATDDRAISRVELYANDRLVESGSGTTRSFEWNPSSSAPGTVKLKVKVYDPSGNSAEQVVSVTVKRDTQAPVVTVLQPKKGAAVPRATVGEIPIQVTVTDNAAVERVEFWVDGAQVATQTASPYAATWNARGAAPGSHLIEVKAYDRSGNLGGAQVAVKVYDELTAPAVQITSPANNGSYWIPATKSVALTFTASDDSGIARVELYANGKLVTTAPGSATLLDWNLAGVAAGTYKLTVKAYDPSANVGEHTVTVLVKADTAKPTVSIVAPVKGAKIRKAATPTVTIRASASDNAGLERVEFWVDGKLLSTRTELPFEAVWELADVPVGNHTIEARAYDRSGNKSSANVTVTVAD